MAEKVKRDQELNRQQQEKAEQKARAAQVKQLIEASRLPKLTTEDYFNFVDDKKVKRLSVNSLMRSKLSNGSLAIVHHGGSYEVIPREAALKVQERDPRRIVMLSEPTPKSLWKPTVLEPSARVNGATVWSSVKLVLAVTVEVVVMNRLRGFGFYGGPC